MADEGVSAGSAADWVESLLQEDAPSGAEP
jgi:hypothetical protein